MTGAFWFVWPVLLLSLACIGTGLLCLAVSRLLDRGIPIWLSVSIAYFLGQGILATVFLFLALAGFLSAALVGTLVGILALVGLVAVVRERKACQATAVRVWEAWRGGALLWRVVAIAAVLLFGYGFTTISGNLIVDAPAFYMAIAKMIGGTGRLTPLPGYDPFSSVGLNGELLMAALFRLGMSGTTPRVLSWVSYIPTLALMYGLARICSVGRRGSLLAVVMAITSSSATVLWGAGKTDLLAIGPALAACVLVLLVWGRVRAGAGLLVAGLLAGFASVCKASYVVAFLPGLTTLVIWHAAQVPRSPGAVGDLNALARASARALIPFAVGFLVAFSPNVLKNQLILGAAFSHPEPDPYFTRATTERLLLSYPIALTYGRYWAEAGTLSPLVLTFAPLAVYLRRSAVWIQSRLLALTVAALIGTAAWMFLYPSVITTRYFLATLLLYCIPAAAAAEAASRRSRTLSLIVAAAAIVVMIETPIQTDAQSPSFTSVRAVLSQIVHPVERSDQRRCCTRRSCAHSDVCSILASA
jgi:hypothetical protein